MYQNDGKSKSTAHDQKHNTSLVKRGGGSNVLTVCMYSMAARGTGSLVFVDNVTVEGSNRINSEVYTAIQCVLKFSQILQISVQPKHTVKAN